jgi:hypothetical protein
MALRLENAGGKILNFTPGPQKRTSPLGENLAPRGDICPLLGGMFTPSFTPRGEHYTIYKNGGANREFHPQGITSPQGDKFHPWGHSLSNYKSRQNYIFQITNPVKITNFKLQIPSKLQISN